MVLKIWDFVNENWAIIENKRLSEKMSLRNKTTGSINLDAVYFFNIILAPITTAGDFATSSYKKA